MAVKIAIKKSEQFRAISTKTVFNVVVAWLTHLGGDARLKEKKGQQSSPAPDSKARTDSEKVSGKREGSSFDNRGIIPCRFFDIVRTCRVIIDIFPCVKITNPKRDAKVAKDATFDKLRRSRIPTRSLRMVVQKDLLLY